MCITIARFDWSVLLQIGGKYAESVCFEVFENSTRQGVQWPLLGGENGESE